jgi:hypothetical protein
MRRMGRVSAVIAVLALVTAGVGAAAPWRPLEGDGVSIHLPASWSEVAPAAGSTSADVDTVLVAGTEGVRPRRTPCIVASYRIPPDGAAVVVVAKRGEASAAVPTDRREFHELRLQYEYLACFDGRAAVAQIALHGRTYQVNVLVGDRAGAHIVLQALSVARSFGLSTT